MSDYATIATNAAAPILRVTLNRPEKRNPIGPLTCGELIHAIEGAVADKQIRVIVLTGAGKAFSAGGDLGAFLGKGGAPESVAEPRSFVDLFATMHGCGIPIIAMANGHALAGGLGLMVACDLVVASSAATFGMTEVRVGLWPMMITAEITRNIGRKKALELMLTGERVSAAKALEIGLVNRVVAPENLEAETDALAAELAKNSPLTMGLGLKAFYATQDMDHGAALAHLEAELVQVLATADAREGLSAFFAKRAPVWPSLVDQADDD